MTPTASVLAVQLTVKPVAVCPLIVTPVGTVGATESAEADVVTVIVVQADTLPEVSIVLTRAVYAVDGDLLVIGMLSAVTVPAVTPSI